MMLPPFRRVLRVAAWRLLCGALAALLALASTGDGGDEVPDGEWLGTALEQAVEGRDPLATLAVAGVLAERGLARDTLPLVAALEWSLGGGSWLPNDKGGEKLERVRARRLRDGAVGRRLDGSIEVLTMRGRDLGRRRIVPPAPDCDVVVGLGNGGVACGFRDGSVRLQDSSGRWLDLAKLEGEVTQLAEVGSAALVVAHGSSSLTVLGIPGGARLARQQHSGLPVVDLLGVSSPASILADQLGDGPLTCWRIGEVEPAWSRPSATGRVVVDVKHRSVVTGVRGGSIACYDLLDGSEKWRVAGDGSEVLDVDIAPAGGVVAVITGGRRLLLFDARSGERQLTCALGAESLYEVALASSGDIAVVSDVEGQLAVILRVNSRWCMLPICKLAAPVELLGFAGAERDLVALSAEGQLLSWEFVLTRGLLDRLREAWVRSPVQLVGKRFAPRQLGDD